MSKLDGNGRWQTKMLLSEHQERYEQRHEKPQSSQPTAEDLTIVRDTILNRHMLTMVDDVIEKAKRETGFVGKLYLTAAFALHDRIIQESKRLKQELRRRNIRYVEDEQSDFAIYHRVFCRGFEERFGMTREIMKSELRVQLTRYIEELEKRMREIPKRLEV